MKQAGDHQKFQHIHSHTFQKIYSYDKLGGFLWR